jgi:hypothetical protein
VYIHVCKCKNDKIKERKKIAMIIIASSQDNRKTIVMYFKQKRIYEEKEQMLDDQNRALVAHNCNPSYSGGRDQEDCSLKPVPGQIVHGTLS